MTSNQASQNNIALSVEKCDLRAEPTHESIFAQTETETCAVCIDKASTYLLKVGVAQLRYNLRTLGFF